MEPDTGGAVVESGFRGRERGSGPDPTTDRLVETAGYFPRNSWCSNLLDKGPTASLREEDVDRAFDLGANAFLVKPSSIEDLTSIARCLRDWMNCTQFPQLAG